MVRQDTLSACLLPLLHGVVQKEVDQDGVDLRSGMVPQNLSPYKLNAPDATTCKSSISAKYPTLP